MGINTRIAYLRELLGLKKKEYASFLGISATIASDIETGAIEPSKNVLLKIAEKQNVNIHWLLTGDGEPFLSKANEAIEDPYTKEFNKKVISATDPRFSDLEARISRIEKQLQNKDYVIDPGEDYQVDTDEFIKIKYVENIAAGIPITQSPDLGEQISVPAKYIESNPEDYYAACISGESMTEAGIKDGSIVLIKKASVPIHNAIQLVRYKNRSTLKRMKQTKKGLWELCYEDGTKKVITATSDAYEVQGDFITVLPNRVNNGRK